MRLNLLPGSASASGWEQSASACLGDPALGGGQGDLAEPCHRRSRVRVAERGEHIERAVRPTAGQRDLAALETGGAGDGEQKETGGFTEFVPLPFVHMEAPIYHRRKARRGPTCREAILMHSVGRIAYRGWIDNVQASWVKLGLDGVRQALQAGCSDLGRTLINENISRAAGPAAGST